MNKYFGRAILKILYRANRFYWTTLNRVMLRFAWRIGRGGRFEGKVFISSFAGSVEIGDSCFFGANVHISSSKNAVLKVGNDVSVNQGAFIVCRESIVIGDKCRVGEYVSIRDNDHEWRDHRLPIMQQGFYCSNVVIGEDVWVGRGAVICKGVHIGKGAVIGAGAIVTKNIPSYSVAVGVPAKVIGIREMSDNSVGHH